MGDAQSAQREGKEDAGAVEEIVKVGAQDEENIEDQLLQSDGQVPGLDENNYPIVDNNVLCKEEIIPEIGHTSSSIVSSNNDSPEIIDIIKEKEECPLEIVKINEKELPNAEEVTPVNINETEVKLNEINESFKRFFSNIGLKLTVKKDLTEKKEKVTELTPEKEQWKTDCVEDNTQDTENSNDNPKQNRGDTIDKDSTTCTTMTDVKSEEVPEDIENETQTTEPNQNMTLDKVAEQPVSIIVDSTENTPPSEELLPEIEKQAIEPTIADEEETMSPLKKFFTQGIFSGLRKNKKSTEQETPKDETSGKELEDMGKTEDGLMREEAAQNAVTIEGEDNENKFNLESILIRSTEKTTETKVQEINENQEEVLESQPAVESEPELRSSQESNKVQGSPLRRLLSGSLKKRSKKHQGKTVGEIKLTDSGEQVFEQLQSPTESAEYQKSEIPSPEDSSAKVDSCKSNGDANADSEKRRDGTWTSFKNLMTPRKLAKRLSLSDDDTILFGTQEEPKHGDGDQPIDVSTEEQKKVESSSSWEAFLCGTGKRRSRNNSDSENDVQRVNEEMETRNTSASQLESSQESDNEHLNSSPYQSGSPSEGDGTPTWKSLKRLVTPKRKAKDEEENKDSTMSDGETNKEESSFSIKKLLSGRKKKKSNEKQEQVSSDDVCGGHYSDDEDSETPAVIPLSEFNTEEEHIDTQGVIQCDMPKIEMDKKEPQQELSGPEIESVINNGTVVEEPGEIEDNKRFVSLIMTCPTNDIEDLTELISKHQQLSDIPEEGLIEESMATPMSAVEETRDDTIAEDIIELTSEAVTAPEPIDVSGGDETTEMVSAVSQLTESSKTSGDTTPIPTECNVNEIDERLQQVVETIGLASNQLSISAEDSCIKEIVGSISSQILESSTQGDAIVLETLQKSDGVAICADLDTTELNVINKSPVSEAICTELEAICTELEPEDSERFATGTARDEVYRSNASEAYGTKGNAGFLGIDSINSSHPLEECLSEVNEVAIVVLSLEEECKEVDEDQLKIKYSDEMNPAESEAAHTLDEEINLTDAVTTVLADSQNVALIQIDPIKSQGAEVTSVFDESQNAVLIKMDQIKIESQEAEITTTVDESQNEALIQFDMIEMEYQEAEETTVIDESPNEALITIDTLDINSQGPKIITVFGESQGEALIQSDPVKEEDLTITKLDAKELGEINEFDSRAFGSGLISKEIDHRSESQTLVECVSEVKETVLPELEPGDETKEMNEAELETDELSGNEINQTVTKSIKTESNDADETSEIEYKNEEIIQTDQNLEKKEDCVKDNITGEFDTSMHMTVADQLSDMVEIFQEFTPVMVSTTTSKQSSAQVLKKTVKAEDIPKPENGKDMASMKGENLYETHFTEVNVEEGEEQEVDPVQVENASVAETITCEVKEVIAYMPDNVTFETTDIPEPLIAVVAQEVEGLDTMESVHTSCPPVNADKVKIAKASNIVETENLSSVNYVIGHEIQVQVVDLDIKSAEAIVDTVLEVSVTDYTEVIDVCKEMDEKGTSLSASLDIEDKITDEASMVETIPQKVVYLSELGEIEMHKATEERTVIFHERQAEEQANDKFHLLTPEQQVSESYVEFDTKGKGIECLSAPPLNVEVEELKSIQVFVEPILAETSNFDQKKDIEEKKAELKKELDNTITGSLHPVQALEIKSPINETEETAKIMSPSHMEPSQSTGSVSQNEGLVSSAVVSTPSNLSLEFKLNIQFGQTVVPSGPVIEKPETLKETQRFEVGVQATDTTESTRQIEEENDVWLDAVEDIYNQEGTWKSCKQVVDAIEREEFKEEDDEHTKGVQKIPQDSHFLGEIEGQHEISEQDTISKATTGEEDAHIFAIALPSFPTEPESTSEASIYTTEWD